MNIHPHSSSGGDGRRPPRDRNRLSVHDKGASRKSKKRQQRQNQPSQQQSGHAQRTNPVFTAADFASESGSFDVMHDPVILANQMSAAAASAGDTGAQIEAAVAQVVAARAAAQRAAAMQAAAAHRAAAQSVAPPAPSTSAPPGSSSWHAARAGASNSDRQIRCPYCSETYTTLNSVRCHVRTCHDREGARHCFRCNFVAPDGQTVRSHMRIHTNAGARASSSREQIKCPYCSMRYLSDEGLRSHVRAVHDKANVHHCYRCRFTAPDPRTVREHSGANHDCRRRCPICQRKLTLTEYVEHVRNCSR